MNQIYLSDCIEILKTIPTDSVDSVITDPPYGYLKHKLDVPFDELTFFTECFRILKDTGFLLYFGRGIPFARWNVMCDNLGFNFKEELVWYKKQISNPLGNVLRVHEQCILFGKNKSVVKKVFVDKLEFDEYTNPKNIREDYKRILGGIKNINTYEDFVNWKAKTTTYYPNAAGLSAPKNIKKHSRDYSTFLSHQRGAICKSLLSVARGNNLKHPTQKPVELFKILVELTTNEEDLVVDPFAGRGTTALACIALNRNYLCIEKDVEYYDIILEEIDNVETNLKRFQFQD